MKTFEPELECTTMMGVMRAGAEGVRWQLRSSTKDN
jgi:hypothetical protein